MFIHSSVFDMYHALSEPDGTPTTLEVTVGVQDGYFTDKQMHHVMSGSAKAMKTIKEINKHRKSKGRSNKLRGPSSCIKKTLMVEAGERENRLI